MSHRLPVRVYVEDTDAGGIVYYANYLKFIERGRSEMVRAYGMDQHRLIEEQGILFVVRRVEADYLRPARLDDLLEVQTSVSEISGARVFIDQSVHRGDEVLFKAKVVIVCIDKQGIPLPVPAENRAQFEQGMA